MQTPVASGAMPAGHVTSALVMAQRCFAAMLRGSAVTVPSSADSPQGGAIVAALFLSEFVPPLTTTTHAHARTHTTSNIYTHTYTYTHT